MILRLWDLLLVLHQSVVVSDSNQISISMCTVDKQIIITVYLKVKTFPRNIFILDYFYQQKFKALISTSTQTSV